MVARGGCVVNGDTVQETGFIATGIGTHGLYPSRDGKKLYITNRGSNKRLGPAHGKGSISVLDFATGKIEVEVLEVVRVGPEMRAQVEGVPFPAALREVAEIALPEPGAAELTVQQVQRTSPRAALRQPRLDVQATILDADLALAPGPARWRRGGSSR